MATALNPLIGYDKAAEIAKKSFKERRPVRELASEMTTLSKADIDAALVRRARRKPPRDERRAGRIGTPASWAAMQRADDARWPRASSKRAAASHRTARWSRPRARSTDNWARALFLKDEPPAHGRVQVPGARNLWSRLPASARAAWSRTLGQPRAGRRALVARELGAPAVIIDHRPTPAREIAGTKG